MTPGELFWGLMFGVIGAAYFMYGRKQHKPVPLLCGIALGVFPYFVSNVWLLLVIGSALSAVPFFVHLD
jgi:hypothetical protein